MKFPKMEDTRHMLWVALIPSYKRGMQKRKKERVVMPRKIIKKNKEKIKTKRDLRAGTKDSRKKKRKGKIKRTSISCLIFLFLFIYVNVFNG